MESRVVPGKSLTITRSELLLPGESKWSDFNGKNMENSRGSKETIRANEKEGKNYLLERLRLEKKNQIKGGIYHKLMIDLTFHSNHMEGNELTHDETRYIFETRTIGIEKNTSKKWTTFWKR